MKQPMQILRNLPVVTVAQMQEIDRRAQDQLGLSVLLLMENAGRAVAETARNVSANRGRGERGKQHLSSVAPIPRFTADLPLSSSEWARVPRDASPCRV